MALQAADGLETVLHTRPILSLGLVFGAGVATSLTPCIYPMIPITVGLLGGRGEAQSRRRTTLLTASYVFGLALVYASLGLLAGITGSLFGAVSANPWAYFFTGNVLLIFGLAYLGVFELAVPTRIATWAARLEARSYPGAFLMGAASGLIAAPCGAPAFGAILAFVGLSGSAVLGFLYLFAFSLGMTALLVVIGLTAGRLGALPRAGRWMLAVRYAGGVLFLAMAEYYFVQMGTVL